MLFDTMSRTASSTLASSQVLWSGHNRGASAKTNKASKLLVSAAVLDCVCFSCCSPLRPIITRSTKYSECKGRALL